ncbi:hypothetical protein H0H93_014940 [Arthromyces matolae]|nr:hypothetical protein H0H93_014940 [Arthromyces matolae]
MIGWEGDNATVGPIAAAAKQSILRLIPQILPPDNDGSNSYSLYRPVLEHGDFGVHNVTVTAGEDDDGLPQITSLFDWETGCIVPALLSDPTVKVAVDLRLDENAGVLITRANDDATPEELDEYASWGRQYYKALFDDVPGYEHAIRAGKDARHLWFALQAWRGEDPEGYFGKLGVWAEGRMRVLAEE